MPGAPRLPRPPARDEAGSDRRRQAKAYEGAFEAVAAVIVASLLGYWADSYFESSPWGLLIGVVLGFSAMVLRLFRLGAEMNITADEAKDAAQAAREKDRGQPED